MYQTLYIFIKTVFLFLGISLSVSISHAVSSILESGFVPTYGALEVKQSDRGDITVRECLDKSIKTIPVYNSLHWMACHFLLQFQLNEKNNETALRVTLLPLSDLMIQPEIQPELEVWLNLHRVMQEKRINDVFIQLETVPQEELLKIQKQLLITTIGNRQGRPFGVYRIPISGDTQLWDIELFQNPSLQVTESIHSILDERTITAVVNALEKDQFSEYSAFEPPLVFKPQSVELQQYDLSERSYMLFPISHNNQNPVSVILCGTEVNSEPLLWLTEQPERLTDKLLDGVNLTELARRQSRQHFFYDTDYSSGVTARFLEYFYDYAIDPLKDEISDKLYDFHIWILRRYTCSMFSMKGSRRDTRSSAARKTRKAEIRAKYSVPPPPKKGLSGFVRSAAVRVSSGATSLRDSTCSVASSVRGSIRSTASSVVESVRFVFRPDEADPESESESESESEFLLSQQTATPPEHQRCYKDKKDNIREKFAEALMEYANHDSKREKHLADLMEQEGKAIFPKDFLKLSTKGQGESYTVMITLESMPENVAGFCTVLRGALHGHNESNKSTLYTCLVKHLSPFGFAFKKARDQGWVVTYDPSQEKPSEVEKEAIARDIAAGITPITRRRIDADNQRAKNLEEIKKLSEKQKIHKKQIEGLVKMNSFLKELIVFIKEQKAFELDEIKDPDIDVMQLIDIEPYEKNPVLLDGDMSWFYSAVDKEEKEIKALREVIDTRIFNFHKDYFKHQYQGIPNQDVIFLFTDFLEKTLPLESWVVRKMFSHDLAKDDHRRTELKKKLEQLQSLVTDLADVSKQPDLPKAMWFQNLVVKTIENHIPPKMRIGIFSGYCFLPYIKKPSPLRRIWKEMLENIPSAVQRMHETLEQQTAQCAEIEEPVLLDEKELDDVVVIPLEELLLSGNKVPPVAEPEDKDQESTPQEGQNSANEESSALLNPFDEI